MGEAYYRFETKLVQRSQGHSAVAAAAYNAGEKIYDDRTGEMHDYTRKTGVYGKEILTPDDAPTWAKDRSELWNAAEKSEKRKDSRTARQFILSYTTVLTPEENQALTRQFLKEEFVNKGFVADVAYHDFEGKNAHNPHAHVLLTTRAVNREGFVAIKDRGMDRKERLYELREKWADIQNRYLEAQGREERVDHRSYQDRGLEKTPGIHEGTKVSAIRRKIERGERTETTYLIDLNDEIDQLNLELLREKAELEALRAKEQDNCPIDREKAEKTTKAVLTSAAPQPETAPDLKTLQQQARDLHQQNELEFSRAVRDIVQSTRTENKIVNAPAVLPNPADKSQIGQVPQNTKYQRQPDEPHDPTWHAVKQQLTAFGGDGNVEVGILDPDTGKMTNRSWHGDQILRFDPKTRKSPILGWLKAKNAEGCHIYVRPAPLANGDSQGLVLHDDIDEVTIDDLKAAGLEPALVVETSHRNCQAWVRLAPSLSREEATQAARRLVQEYGGDPASANYQHYGRMAGFLNKKEKHFEEETGKYPWVKVLEHTGATATNGHLWQQQAAQDAAKRRQERDKAAQNILRARQQATAEELLKAQQAFETFCRQAKSRSERDLSKQDWAAISHLAKKGFSVEALEYALWCSPDLDTRKKGHQQDYVTRTVDSVLRHPDVQAALQRRAERQQRRDERATIKQWQQYKERERDSRAASASTEPEQMKRPGEERKAQSSPGKGKQSKMTIKMEDITITHLGALNEEQVRWMVEKTLASDLARQQFSKAAWLLTQDTSHWRSWKGRAKAEYLKELARTVEVKGAQAYHPYTDAEIGIKLRMAGFGKQLIYNCIKENSPFATHLPDEDAKTRYLYKGIAPVMDNPKINQKIAQWNQFRTYEAIALPEDQRDAYIKEHRLEELKLSITPERWQEQQGQPEKQPTQERER